MIIYEEHRDDYGEFKLIRIHKSQSKMPSAMLCCTGLIHINIAKHSLHFQILQSIPYFA